MNRKNRRNIGIRNDVWNSGLKVVKAPLEVLVPMKIVDVMRGIEDKIGHGNEFSVFCKADLGDISRIVVGEEYEIPKQSVGFASIRYDDEPSDEFNCVVHKHPDGVASFSAVDNEYINKNFAVSLLWMGDEFVDGVVNLDVGDGVKLQLEVYVEIQRYRGAADIDVSNIVVVENRLPERIRGMAVDPYGRFDDEKFDNGTFYDGRFNDGFRF